MIPCSTLQLPRPCHAVNEICVDCLGCLLLVVNARVEICERGSREVIGLCCRDCLPRALLHLPTSEVSQTNTTHPQTYTSRLPIVSSVLEATALAPHDQARPIYPLICFEHDRPSSQFPGLLFASTGDGYSGSDRQPIVPRNLTANRSCSSRRVIG